MTSTSRTTPRFARPCSAPPSRACAPTTLERRRPGISCAAPTSRMSIELTIDEAGLADEAFFIDGIAVECRPLEPRFRSRHGHAQPDAGVLLRHGRIQPVSPEYHAWTHRPRARGRNGSDRDACCRWRSSATPCIQWNYSSCRMAAKRGIGIDRLSGMTSARLRRWLRLDVEPFGFTVALPTTSE